MSTRVLLAGILGGIAMFVWSAIPHMVLPLGEAGFREIPDEQSVVGAMNSAIGDQAGFYIFPGPGLGPNPTREQRSEAMKRMAEDFPKHASGLLIYHPPGRSFSFGKSLGTEFVTELLEAILIVFLLTQHGYKVSALALVLFSSPGFSPQSQPTFLIGTGMVFLPITLPPTC
jgi:hypothetical protein